MKALHAIVRIPRSGSTLACVLLNQNSAFFATSTSDTPALIDAIAPTWDGFQATSMRAVDPEAQRTSERNTVLGAIEGKYHFAKGMTVFDKSPAWGERWHAFSELYPKGKALVFIRDLRAVLGSILKRDREHPLDSLFGDEVRTPEQKMQFLCQPDQMVGYAVRNVMSVRQWGGDRAMFLRHQRWTGEPERYFRQVYRHLGIRRYWDHDFLRCDGHGGDLDALLHGKYPHTVFGPVTRRDDHEWEKYMSEEMADWVTTTFPAYQKLVEGRDEWTR